MVRKSLHNKEHFREIISRISKLSEHSPRKWGKMDVSQMLLHCDLILQVALKKTDLPQVNPLFRLIGILTKHEMSIFNNGIPHNMPTFQKVIVNFECRFEDTKEHLLKTLHDYQKVYESKCLPANHVLFGKMSEKDWGFLEYKHLNHHLKQFYV